jgi:hypothetical protein
MPNQLLGFGHNSTPIYSPFPQATHFVAQAPESSGHKTTTFDGNRCQLDGRL